MKYLYSQIGIHTTKTTGRFVYEVGKRDDYFEGDVNPADAVNGSSEDKDVADIQYEIEEAMYGKAKGLKPEYDGNYNVPIEDDSIPFDKDLQKHLDISG